MKRFALILTFVFSISIISTAQVPEVQIKNLDGTSASTSTFKNDGKPMVISFWATWCKPCVKELNAINENYIDWEDETGVKVIAVSIDNSRSMNRVKPFVNGRAWEFDVYCDPNGDFKRAMNVGNVPHTFLIDGNGKIVWQHTSYADGDEDHLYELIQKLAAGESID